MQAIYTSSDESSNENEIRSPVPAILAMKEQHSNSRLTDHASALNSDIEQTSNTGR